MARKRWPGTGLHPRGMILARLLKEARVGRGWGQEDFAEAIGVSRPTLASYEDGKTSPPAEVLCRIEDLLHVRMSELWARAFREELGLVLA